MSASRSLMVLPDCPSSPSHGQMELCNPGTPEQAWCGVCYRCIHCHSGTLFPSAELIAHNARLSARAALAKAVQS